MSSPSHKKQATQKLISFDSKKINFNPNWILIIDPNLPSTTDQFPIFTSHLGLVYLKIDKNLLISVHSHVALLQYGLHQAYIFHLSIIHSIFLYILLSFLLSLYLTFFLTFYHSIIFSFLLSFNHSSSIIHSSYLSFYLNFYYLLACYIYLHFHIISTLNFCFI